MNLLIDNRTEEMLTAELEEAILKAAAESLKYEEFDENCEISVSIVDNEEIRQINKQFRNIDRATDVLSFPMLTFSEQEQVKKTIDRLENRIFLHFINCYWLYTKNAITQIYGINQQLYSLNKQSL